MASIFFAPVVQCPWSLYMFLPHLTSLNQGCLVKYSNCIHSAILTTFMDFWLFFTCFQLLAIYDVYKVYMSRWCRLHFLSLWNNKDIKSRSKLCTVFIKNTLTSLFVSNQNEKPQAEKNWEKNTCCPEILLDQLIDNVYIHIWKSILRRGRLFQIYHICGIFQGTFHLGLVFAKLLILNICISSILGSHARGREGDGKLVRNEQNFFPTASPPHVFSDACSSFSSVVIGQWTRTRIAKKHWVYGSF